MSIRLYLLGAAAISLATAAPAETLSNRNAVKLLSPFTLLMNSEAGRKALDDNLQRTIAINRNSNAAERSQARSDNAIITNGSQFTIGLGSTLDQRYQAALKNTALASRTSAINGALSQFTSFTGADSSFGKMYFANGTGASATTPLPSGGMFDIYDAAYGKPASNADPYGNPRPYQTASSRIDWFAGDLLTAYNWSPSFPSGHTTFGTTEALLQAMAVPERFSQEIARGLEYGYSRVVLGAHYTADVIAGRVLALQDVANMLNGVNGYTSSNFAATFDTFRSNFRSILGGDSGIADAVAASDPGRFGDIAKTRSDAATRMTYGIAATGDTGQAAIVPVGAEVLLKTRFTYLSDDQRRDVLASTELPSGGFLDDGSGWARLDLVRAGAGYGAFRSTVTIRQDAAQGGFAASDTFDNDIGGAGGLVHEGSGTLRLTGANSYAGGTVISGGAIVAGSRSALGTGPVRIDGGTLAVGAGGLSLADTFTMGSDALLRFANPFAMLSVGGLSVLDGTLSIDMTDFTGGDGDFQILSLHDYVGQFAATRITGLRDGYATRISYRNDGVYIGVAAAAVPEPASWLLMLGGIACAGGALRRRRANKAVRHAARLTQPA